jgi:hypothetical protein
MLHTHTQFLIPDPVRIHFVVGKNFPNKFWQLTSRMGRESNSLEPSLGFYKAASCYAYGYGYHLFLFLLYVIQSCNDNCYYYY